MGKKKHFNCIEKIEGSWKRQTYPYENMQETMGNFKEQKD
jgi:hypothetical protein